MLLSTPIDLGDAIHVLKHVSLNALLAHRQRTKGAVTAVLLCKFYLFQQAGAAISGLNSN